MKKVSLLKVFWKKEKIHWNRLREMSKKFSKLGKFTGYLIVSIIVTLFHYVFMFAHFTFEVILFLFARQQFRLNMQKLYSN